MAEIGLPHKRLWRLTDDEGCEIACDLEILTSNRVLLTVTRNGSSLVTETFSDKRDALARGVGLYKEMKGHGSGSRNQTDQTDETAR